MKTVYNSGKLVVIKSPVDKQYTFFADRIPLLKTTPQGAKELAEAILREEQEDKDGSS